MDKLYQFYRPIEMNYQMSIQEKEKHMDTWYSQCMDLYYQHGLTREKLQKSVQKSNLIFRKGAKEFLQMTQKQQIPVIILSAGIGNVIQQFLKENNCYFENIYIISNFIEFNSDGSMKPFDNSKIIHSLNKTMKGHLPKSFEDKIRDKPFKVLIGDLIEDEKMIEQNEWTTTLKVAFLNEYVEKNLEKYRNHFDIVLTEQDAIFPNWGLSPIWE